MDRNIMAKELKQHTYFTRVMIYSDSLTLVLMWYIISFSIACL